MRDPELEAELKRIADHNRLCDEKDMQRLSTRNDIGRRATLRYMARHGRKDLAEAAEQEPENK